MPANLARYLKEIKSTKVLTADAEKELVSKIKEAQREHELYRKSFEATLRTVQDTIQKNRSASAIASAKNSGRQFARRTSKSK